MLSKKQLELFLCLLNQFSLEEIEMYWGRQARHNMFWYKYFFETEMILEGIRQYAFASGEEE